MHHREEGINESVAQLPKCACHDRCKFPQLPWATGHHCPGCKLAIHAVCGIHDDKAGLDDSNWCYDCWEAKIHQDQQEKRPTLTSKTTRAMPSPTDNEQFPSCACRERCRFPHLPPASGHHCPGCKFSIHAVCGIHDETAGLADSNWCYSCWDSKMQQKMPARRTSVVHQQKKKGAMLTSTKKNLLWYLPPLQTMISFPSSVHAARDVNFLSFHKQQAITVQPGCKLAIHAVCGIHDEQAGLDDSNWCYDCWDSKMQQKMR